MPYYLEVFPEGTGTVVPYYERGALFVVGRVSARPRRSQERVRARRSACYEFAQNGHLRALLRTKEAFIAGREATGGLSSAFVKVNRS